MRRADTGLIQLSLPLWSLPSRLMKSKPRAERQLVEIVGRDLVHLVFGFGLDPRLRPGFGLLRTGLHLRKLRQPHYIFGQRLLQGVDDRGGYFGS